MANFKEEIARIRLIALDVDGVMTDGGIQVAPDGDFIRRYNSKDGFSLSYALKKGYEVAVITGGRGDMLNVRMKMLGIKHLYTNSLEKLEALNDVMAKTGIRPEEVLYMGDDIPDIEPMLHVGMPVCPADAATEVINVSKYVSQFRGGEGCVRDVVEQVMRARGDWFKPGENVEGIASR